MQRGPTGAALDALDRKLLDLYQRDTRQSAESLGSQIGLSATAVQRRLRRLRAEGVIVADVALLSPDKLGLAITVIVHVDLERESVPHIDNFKARMQQVPAVQQCWYTTGQTDFVLVVRTSSMAEYEQFTRDELLGCDNVREFTSHVVLDEVQRWAPLPLPKPSE